LIQLNDLWSLQKDYWIRAKSYFYIHLSNINPPSLKKAITFLLLIINLRLMSQATIEGEYYFRKMEMASGFNFTQDGRFQFFYTYGAVDRTATGSFTVERDSLKLKSDKEPGKDFALVNQSKQGNGYSVIFKHPNKYLLKILFAFSSPMERDRRLIQMKTVK
jgi:hypothetical protein